MFEQREAKKFYQTMCDYFDRTDITCEKNEKQLVLLLKWLNQPLPVYVFLMVQAKPLTLEVMARLPITVPQETRATVAKGLRGVNQTLESGHFQIDMTEGKLDYRIKLPLAGCRVSEGWFDAIQWEAYHTMSRFGEKMYHLAGGDVTLEEFLEQVR